MFFVISEMPSKTFVMVLKNFLITLRLLGLRLNRFSDNYFENNKFDMKANIFANRCEFSAHVPRCE